MLMMIFMALQKDSEGALDNLRLGGGPLANTRLYGKERGDTDNNDGEKMSTNNGLPLSSSVFPELS